MLAVIWQTHGHDAAAVRTVRPARARLQAAAVQAPAAARHLHEPRRPRGYGDRPAARRRAARTRTCRPCQSGRRHAQSHGQRNCISQETSKSKRKPPHVAM